MTDNQKPALLVVGHGSRDVDAVEEFHRLAEHFQEKYPDRLCATGFLEFARPVIADGIDKLVAQGATKITAIPGMLMAAGHAKNDIPSELNTLQAEIEGIDITYGTHLGVHANMVRASAARIEEAEAQMIEKFGDDYDRKDTLLVVVGRGASDSDANSNPGVTIENDVQSYKLQVRGADSDILAIRDVTATSLADNDLAGTDPSAGVVDKYV